MKNRKLPNPSARELAVKTLFQWLQKEPGDRGEIEDLANAFLLKSSLSSRDKALYWQLVFGTIRWLRLLKYHLKRYLKKFSKLPLKVQVILYIGAYQIIFLSKIPFFSAVDESVKLAKRFRFNWAKGLINASLRALSRGSKKIILKEEDVQSYCNENFLNCLSNLTSHPYWMVKRWYEQWDKAKCINICINNNIQSSLCIRVNNLKITTSELIKIFEKQGINAKKGLIAENSLRIFNYKGSVEKLPGLNEGLFQVQDESSQLAVELLNPLPGEKILDVCAGIGGKTTYIAQLVGDEAEIIATDINIRRLKKLQENVKRLGIKSISAYHLEQGYNKIISKAPFDKILIDAPCSGFGVIRRHPDIKWNRTPNAIAELSKIQLDLLNKWSTCLKEGGLLLYCVCTMEREETDEVIKAFLKKNKKFSLVSLDKASKTRPKDIFLNRTLRIFPGQYDMDGFYGALLKKH